MFFSLHSFGPNACSCLDWQPISLCGRLETGTETQIEGFCSGYWMSSRMARGDQTNGLPAKRARGLDKLRKLCIRGLPLTGINRTCRPESYSSTGDICLSGSC